MTGRFIVFEGTDGCGKSTQAARLAERLDAVLTRQPGGTDIGARIRAIVLASADQPGAPLADRAEALLMAADRAQHEAEVIGPALAADRHVVCDRYIPSSIAYQGHGRGLDPDEVRRISEWAVGGRSPDLVVLLVVPEEVARQRRGPSSDRIESAGDDFHRRVATAYRQMAADHPELWAVVEGTGTPDEVAARVQDVCRDRLGIP
jgi:dTMP kinase